LFTYDKDIHIPALDLWLDSNRVKPFGFISHAHGDHIARHKNIICSKPTGDVIRRRLKNPSFTTYDYEAPFMINDHQVTFYPAGHILGSTQIKIEKEGQSLLYTGDFRLKRSRTAEPFQTVTAHTLIMETTFGKSIYKIPDREQSEDRLIEQCRKYLKQGVTPVVFAYTLGKGQEALKILSEAGLPVAVDYMIMQYVSTYKKYGVKFGDYVKFKRSEYRNQVLLLPPNARNHRYLQSIGNLYTIFLSGWGMNERARSRFRVDEVIPFSDHADFDELLELVERVNPQEVYCTHGFDEFVNTLNNGGYRAYRLESKR
jgi:Cft2 family RNA processing exonuclease